MFLVDITFESTFDVISPDCGAEDLGIIGYYAFILGRGGGNILMGDGAVMVTGLGADAVITGLKSRRVFLGEGFVTPVAFPAAGNSCLGILFWLLD
jgi:hypothetical protein